MRGSVRMLLRLFIPVFQEVGEDHPEAVGLILRKINARLHDKGFIIGYFYDTNHNELHLFDHGLQSVID